MTLLPRIGSSLLPLVAILLRLVITTPLHAQHDADDPPETDSLDLAPLTGYNRIGITGGFNSFLNSFDDGSLPTIRKSSQPPRGPAGSGFQAGIVVARLMPNFFITHPSSPADEADPERLYRRLTTFELRLLYTRMEGSSTAHDYYPIKGNTDSLYVEQQIHSLVNVITLEPQFLFDIGPMRRSTSGFVSVGTSLGYITEARLASKVVPAEPIAEQVPLPSSGDEPYDARSFYAALLLGGGMRIGLGGDSRTAPALLPSATVIVPFTTIGRNAQWLPFGVRLGVALYWPV
jgi:hypothetical protein